ncbi:conserved hypothetical protein [Trichophyton verrucosum HKI 0517]|uniref:Uncharacterized protein n=1 Tax=Trichophyton verrucosum (strain HKI 0517) TaxID=663202 RepID=D4DG68_TRIVH|nr:uncharacterized protein TRV_06170 [Trichophyton verrucosum HKI 0517]EFE39169.1 conserved hypothetical protein [Trichophyton verrucosum HKI 0517]
MRLRQRDNIRPPERYGGGDWIGNKASGRRGASRATSETPDDLPRQPHIPLIARPTAGPPPFIDYNPNSPPAAFPTLDKPRPIEMPPVNNETASSGSCENEFQSEPWSDMESSEDDDSGEDADHSVDVEDYKYLHAPTHVEWKDLNPAIQMEIIQNLTQVYTWPRVVYMLELTPQQQEEAIQSPARRQKQVEDEAQQLHEMQVKQLRALLRIDNSVLRKSRVPGQLVFRNISKQYFREAKNRATVDHFMIKASDLLAARRFLRRLGIDTKYAGEWKNDLATINQAHEENGEDEFKWILSTEETEQSSSTPSIQLGSSSPSLQPHNAGANSANGQDRCFVNRVGNPGAGTFRVPVREELNEPMHSTPLNAAQQILSRRKSAKKPDRKTPNRPMNINPASSIVRLNIGPEGAAQIRNVMHTTSSLSPQSSQNLPSSPPIPLASTTNHPPSSSLWMSQTTDSRKRPHSETAITPGSFVDEDDLPLQRVLSGPWWYNSGQVISRAGITSSQTLHERLYAARAETEIQRQSFARPIGRLPPVPQVNLPIRNSTPLNNRQATPMPYSDDTIAQTPPPGYSSPVPQRHVLPNKNFKSLLIDMPGDNVPTRMTSASSDNSEHGPPYSPISPVMGTFPVAQVQAAGGGQTQDNNLRKVRTLQESAIEDGQHGATSSILDDGVSSNTGPVGTPASLPTEAKSSRPSSVEFSHTSIQTAGEDPLLEMKFPESMENTASKAETSSNISIATTFAVCCDIPPIESMKKNECNSHLPIHSPPDTNGTGKENEFPGKSKPAKKKAKLAPTDRRRSSRLNKPATTKETRARAAASVTKKRLGN